MRSAPSWVRTKMIVRPLREAMAAVTGALSLGFTMRMWWDIVVTLPWALSTLWRPPRVAGAGRVVFGLPGGVGGGLRGGVPGAAVALGRGRVGQSPLAPPGHPRGRQ